MLDRRHPDNNLKLVKEFVRSGLCKRAAFYYSTARSKFCRRFEFPRAIDALRQIGERLN